MTGNDHRYYAPNGRECAFRYLPDAGNDSGTSFKEFFVCRYAELSRGWNVIDNIFELKSFYVYE